MTEQEQQLVASFDRKWNKRNTYRKRSNPFPIVARVELTNLSSICMAFADHKPCGFSLYVVGEVNTYFTTESGNNSCSVTYTGIEINPDDWELVKGICPACGKMIEVDMLGLCPECTFSMKDC